VNTPLRCSDMACVFSRNRKWNT